MAHACTLVTSALLIGMPLAGCANGEPAALQPATLTASQEAPAASPVQQVSATTASAAGLQPDGTYVLNSEELKLDCKKLTGRMTIRILQMRDYEIRNRTTSVSRTGQQVFTPLFGGSKHGVDPDADYRRDRAQVEAYNKRLAEKKCKVFDLMKELQPKPARESPTPVKKS